MNYENYLIIINLYSNLTHVHIFVAASNIEILGQASKQAPAYKYVSGFLTYNVTISSVVNYGIN